MAVRNKRRLMVIAALAVSSHLYGCGDWSRNPLSDPDAARPDKRVIGTWCSTDPDDKQQVTYLHLGLSNRVEAFQRDWNFMSTEVAEKILQEQPERFNDFMRATRIDFHDGRIFSQTALLFPTRLGSSWYASLPCYRETDGGRISCDYSFWRYNLEGDTLTVWGPGDFKKVIIEAIENGKLTGEVRTRVNIGEYPQLTDSTENIRKFLLAEGDAKVAKVQGTKFRRISP